MFHRHQKVLVLGFLALNLVAIGFIAYASAQYQVFNNRISLKHFSTPGEAGRIGGIVAIPKTVNASTPVVVVCHGFSSFKERMLGQAVELALHDIIGIVIDLRGHKSSDGIATFGMREWRDVSAALDWASVNLICNISNSGCIGSSMGAVTAIMSGIFEPRIRVVCESSAFANISDLVDNTKSSFFSGVPDFIKSNMNVPLDFSPIDYVNTTLPQNLLVLHGVKDDAVPFDHGAALYQKASANGTITDTRQFFISNNTGHDIWHADSEAWGAIIDYCELKLLGRTPSKQYWARHLTTMPDMFFYRAVPLQGISLFLLIPMLGELGKGKSKDQNGALDQPSASEFGAIPWFVLMMVFIGSIGLIIIGGWIDRLLLDWIYISNMNLFIPNLFIVIPCLFILLGLLHRKYQKSPIILSTFGLEWNRSAGWVVGGILIYFLGMLNLGAYVSYSPYLLPRSNFLSIFVPFFLFMLAIEGIVWGIWWPIYTLKVKMASPRKEVSFLLVSVGLILGVTYILSQVYLPVQMALGLLNPQMMLLAMSVLAAILGWIFYNITKNWIIGAFLIAIIIAIFMSALFPAF